ncbi:MAG: hypothetical protein O3B82_01200 [Bacteroidetes bacterium]|nr:hypothetical protein [Bacteroidota bacterium]
MSKFYVLALVFVFTALASKAQTGQWNQSTEPLGPESILHDYYTAENHYQNGRFSTAAKNFQSLIDKAAEADETISAPSFLGAAYFRLSCIAALDYQVQKDDTVNSLFKTTHSSHKKDYDLAIYFSSEAVRIEPENQDFLFHYATLLTNNNHWEEATIAFVELVHRNPHSWTLHETAAEGYLKLCNENIQNGQEKLVEQAENLIRFCDTWAMHFGLSALIVKYKSEGLRLQNKPLSADILVWEEGQLLQSQFNKRRKVNSTESIKPMGAKTRLGRNYTLFKKAAGIMNILEMQAQLDSIETQAAVFSGEALIDAYKEYLIAEYIKSLALLTKNFNIDNNTFMRLEFIRLIALNQTKLGLWGEAWKNWEYLIFSDPLRTDLYENDYAFAIETAEKTGNTAIANKLKKRARDLDIVLPQN